MFYAIKDADNALSLLKSLFIWIDIEKMIWGYKMSCTKITKNKICGSSELSLVCSAAMV